MDGGHVPLEVQLCHQNRLVICPGEPRTLLQEPLVSFSVSVGHDISDLDQLQDDAAHYVADSTANATSIEESLEAANAYFELRGESLLQTVKQDLSLLMRCGKAKGHQGALQLGKSGTLPHLRVDS